jgi:ABC-type glycerol-3-phosphate transport system substrate-binding protein
LWTILTVFALASLSAMAAAEETITLEWWTHATLSQRELYYELIEEFEAMHPNVKVNLQVPGDWDDMWTRLLTAIAAGEGCDVMRAKDFWVDMLAPQGALLDLTPYIERDREELEIDDYYIGLMEAYRHGDRIYALPWHVYYYNLYYNVDLFEEAGLAGPPETWDEVVEYSKKLTDPAKMRFGTQMMTYTGKEPFLAKVMEMFARQNSQNPELEPWDVNSRIPNFNGLTGEAMIGAMEFWRDLMYNTKTCLPPELSTMPMRIENGMIGFWWNSPIGASELRKIHTDLNFRMARNPGKYNSGTVVEQNAFFAMSMTKHPEMTWELVKFLTSKEVNYKYCTDGVYLPTRQTEWEQAPFNSDPDYLVARQQLMDPNNVFHTNYTKNWQSIMTTLATEVENVMRNSKAPAAAMQDAIRSMHAEMVKDYGDQFQQ